MFYSVALCLIYTYKNIHSSMIAVICNCIAAIIILTFKLNWLEITKYFQIDNIGNNKIW